MQSEEFDKKAREAADHHYPAYDEQAWTKMEKLLDQHLPEKDNRRRIIFFLLFFLLLGSAVVFFIQREGQGSKPITATTGPKDHVTPNKQGSGAVTGNYNNTNDNNTSRQIPDAVNNRPADDRVAVNNLTGTKIQNPVPATNALIIPTKTTQNSPVKENRISGTVNKSLPPIHAVPATMLVPDQVTVVANTSPAIAGNAGAADNKKQASNVQVNTNSIPAPDKMVAEKTKPDPKTGSDNTSVKPTTESNSATETKPVTAAVTKKKGGLNKNSALFFSLSTGPDLSASGSDNFGKTKLLAGVGIGYTFKNRFTLRTGFYSSRKIYTASPYQYHPPTVFWSYYPDLQQVNADCKVYEIPLYLSYNFTRKARQNFFGTVGISSYLMKRETYNYLYKTPGGQLQDHEVTLLDKNKHYFSVLTLSAGYQYNFNKTFSVMAEPYMKLPLAGIGYGKVNLNSAGVLLSAVVKPFGNRKSKTQH